MFLEARQNKIYHVEQNSIREIETWKNLIHEHWTKHDW